MTKLDWFFPIKFTYESLISKNQSQGLAESVRNFFIFPSSVINWFGYPSLFVILFITLLFFLKPNLRQIWLVLIFLVGVISWGIFNIIGAVGFTFPRYWNIGQLTLALCIGLIYQQLKFKLGFKIKSFSIPIVSILISWAYLNGQKKANMDLPNDDMSRLND
jgi:hypothetical protein